MSHPAQAPAAEPAPPPTFKRKKRPATSRTLDSTTPLIGSNEHDQDNDHRDSTRSVPATLSTLPSSQAHPAPLPQRDPRRAPRPPPPQALHRRPRARPPQLGRAPQARKAHRDTGRRRRRRRRHRLARGRHRRGHPGRVAVRRGRSRAGPPARRCREPRDAPAQDHQDGQLYRPDQHGRRRQAHVRRPAPLLSSRPLSLTSSVADVRLSLRPAGSPTSTPSSPSGATRPRPRAPTPARPRRRSTRATSCTPSPTSTSLPTLPPPSRARRTATRTRAT